MPNWILNDAEIQSGLANSQRDKTKSLEERVGSLEQELKDLRNLIEETKQRSNARWRQLMASRR